MEDTRHMPPWLTAELVTCLGEACDFTERNALALGVDGPTIKALTNDWRMVLSEAAAHGFVPEKDTADADA